jgi:hypothetical protein
VGHGAAKRLIASGAREALIVQEARGVEVRGVGVEDARAEVQLPVRHEQLAAGAEQLAADGGFGGDVRADGRVGEAQELVVERGEQRAVLEQVRHVEAAGGVEGGLDLGLDGAEEGGVVREVGEAPEAEFVGVDVDAGCGGLAWGLGWVG